MSSEPESPIPSQIFPLAHPPPKPPHWLRLAPRLVLQIQQLSPGSGRPVPVLEVLRPSRLGKALAVGGGGGDGGGGARVKLSSRGLYIAQSEPFLHLAPRGASTACDAVGAISSLAPRGGPCSDVLYFAGECWAVLPTARGYRFQQTVTGKSLAWEQRPRADGDKGDRFVLSIVAPVDAEAEAEDLRRPWLATLTKRGLKVPPWERGQRAYLAVEEEVAYTWVLTMGVYVAAQEGWICV